MTDQKLKEMILELARIISYFSDDTNLQAALDDFITKYSKD